MDFEHKKDYLCPCSQKPSDSAIPFPIMTQNSIPLLVAKTLSLYLLNTKTIALATTIAEKGDGEVCAHWNPMSICDSSDPANNIRGAQDAGGGCGLARNFESIAYVYSWLYS